MKRLLFVALIGMVSGGCKKTMDKLENSASNPQPAAGGNQGGGGFGAVQAARKMPVVTAIEMHDLHLMMNTAKLSSGHVPTSQETWAALNQPDGNRQLVQLIQNGLIVLVPNPGDEGLWAYSREAPTQGGWVITHNGESRVTAAEFAQLQRSN